MAENKTLLDMCNVTFSYPGAKVDSSGASQFSFSINAAKGDILAITGASGAGKSTLFDLIAGFALPASGSILIDGQAVQKQHPALRGVSILFQRDNLFSQLSALDNVCLALAPKHRPTQAQRAIAADALGEAGLGDLLDQRADQLSGGQAQRVALVRESLRDTKLFLLDEPFNGLDEESRETMIGLVQTLVANRERSVLIITHDLGAISPIITGHVVVENGSCKRVS